MKKSDNIYKMIFYAISIFFVLFLIYYYPQLPEKIASHFNFSGEPDGWMSKNSFYVFMILMFIVLSGSIYLASYLMNKIPDSLINLPNKKYHLNPERKDITIRAMNNFLLLSISLTIALLIAVNYLTFSFILRNSDKLSSSFEIILIVYLVIIFTLIVSLYLKFKRIPA